MDGSASERGNRLERTRDLLLRAVQSLEENVAASVDRTDSASAIESSHGGESTGR